MVDYLAHFESTLAALKDERRYRVFADLERQAGRFPHAHWHNPAGKSDVAYWCHLGGMLAGAVLFPLMRLPGVQLFECARQPHYPAASDRPHVPARAPQPAPD